MRSRRLQVPADHAVGVQLAQQLVRHQQRVQLPLAEPHPRQLALLAAGLGDYSIAVREPVVLDRCAELVAQVLQVALQGGRRDLELLEQRLEVHMPAVADEHLDLVDAGGLGHRSAPGEAHVLSHPKYIPCLALEGARQAADGRFVHRSRVADDKLRS
jgi:hypothetical protein